MFTVHSVVSATDAKQCHKMALNHLIPAPDATDARQAAMSVNPPGQPVIAIAHQSVRTVS